LIGQSAETVFLREAATAGTNAHTIFGGENPFKSQCTLHRKKRELKEASTHWQHEALVKGI
jgi:hypothetical protein